MLQVNALSGFGVDASNSLRIEFLGSYESTTDTTSRTFSSVNFGTPAENRYLIALINGIEGPSTLLGGTISAVTIGGVTATRTTQPSLVFLQGIAAAAVPEGTSGNVVVTTSRTTESASITMFAVYGINSATPTSQNRNRVTSTTQKTLSTTIDGSIGNPVFLLVPAWKSTNATGTITGVTLTSYGSVNTVLNSGTTDFKMWAFAGFLTTSGTKNVDVTITGPSDAYISESIVVASYG